MPASLRSLAPQSKRTSLRKTLLLAVLAAATALSAGCGLLPAEEEILPLPLITPQTVVYQTKAAVRGDLVKTQTLTAYLSPTQRVTVSFHPAGGRLKSLRIVSGQMVKAGDVLAELETGTLASEVRIQEIEVQKSELSLQKLKDSGADATSVRIAQLSLEQLRIRLALQKEQLAATRLVAPISGKVVFVASYAAGDLVGAYDAVAMIADVTAPQLVAKGSEASRLPLGAPVAITYAKVEYAGEVVANGSTLANDPDETMHEAAIFAFTGAAPEGVALGRDMKVVFLVDQRIGVIVLDRSAVKVVAGRRYVDVLVDGLRTEKDVEVGLQTDTECEIVKGVDEGDLVIVG